jgi:diguanylate cyclase (GGDEF)-like protein/PAS domain S-box-containing protein
MKTQPGSLLIVDDEEMNRDMLSQRLELKGYAVTAASDGRQALTLIDRHPFDVILLDVMMPELNGLEVLRILRQRYALAELAVIMVTAKDHSEDVVEAFNLGANDYVTKPIDLPVVLARIATQVSHKRAQAALRASEARYALAARGTNNGLWDWDIPANEVYYSPRWKAMLGHEDGEIGTSPEEWFRRIHPEDAARVQDELTAHRRGDIPHFACEHRLFHKDQTYRWMLACGVAVRDGAGMRMAGSLTDVTEGKVTDSLTGLPNRILLLDRIERSIERLKGHPEARFAVLFLDLDRFKMVNDSLGHLVGDQLLIAFARRLEGCLRASDIVSRTASEHTIARLGGDEFTILLEGIETVGDAIKVADRIHSALAIPFDLDGHELFIAASIGITLGEPGYQRPEDLLRDADTALYSAKAGGKSRYEVFDSAMRTQVVARLQLESDLRRALERDELRLHYQPIMSLENERLIGFEALLRWQHPQRGLLPPDDFIAMAEENGLIIPIGWWVLDEALRQFGEWHGRFPDIRPLMICVNLSPKQFFQASLVDRVERRLSDTGVDPRSLKLEVTEHAIMSDPESAAATLTRLRSLGVQIGIDDFGTGYSSLNYLRRFPIDTLKIDRSFVHRMSSDVKDLEIVQTILTLAHNLAMDVVAEGVETIHQRDQLQTLGCELGQGFYFSRAIEGPAAEMLLARCLPRPEEPRVRKGPVSETGPPIDPTCLGCTAPHDP